MEDHLADTCPKKDEIPRDDWNVNKAVLAQLATNKHEDANTNTNGNGTDNNQHNQIDENASNGNNNSNNSENDNQTVHWNTVQLVTQCIGHQGFQANIGRQQNKCMQNYMFHQMQYEPVNFSRDALLDTGANFSSTNNPKLIDNEVTAVVPMNMRTNSGAKQIDKIGDLPGLIKKMWVDHTASATVLSFADLANQYHIQYDNKYIDTFFLQEWDHKEPPIKFPRNYVSNLYNFRFLDKFIEQKQNEAIQFVQTIAENRANYSNEQYERAKVTR